MSALDQLLGKDFEVRMGARSVRDKANEEVKRYRERDLLSLQKKPTAVVERAPGLATAVVSG